MLAGGETSGLKITLDTSLPRNASPLAALDSESTIQLPLELLQKVFLFLADLCLPPRRFSPFPYPSRPVWIAITYVCRYWRSAALGLYELWSSITPGLSISWSRSMIERSAQLPMRIDMRIRPCFADGLEALAASKLLLRSPGIRTLRLSGYRADILNILDHLCSPSSLENLDLWVMAYASDYVDLPVALFGGKTPHFRHLKFETTTRVRAPPWLLAGITHFTTSAVFSLHEFLGVLQEMQQLEVLRLVTIFGPWRVTAPSEQVPLHRVTLPRLSLLFFCGNNPSDFVVLSSHIDAPPTLRRHLSWRVEAVSSWGQWATMFAATQAFVPGDSALGVNDGGLRVAHVVGGYERGSFEMWSRTYSESASTTAPREPVRTPPHRAYRGPHHRARDRDRRHGSRRQARDGRAGRAGHRSAMARAACRAAVCTDAAPARWKSQGIHLPFHRPSRRRRRPGRHQRCWRWLFCGHYTG
ncbi:hypothetical protein EDB83DRAFT_86928 [Lactarius deliciosus]|nr:hypothetical protein EDB83DRAFT_86928 [Lactarius deliciosus]